LLKEKAGSKMKGLHISQRRLRVGLAAALAILGLLLPAASRVRAQDLIPTQNPTGRPEVLRDVGFDQKLNSQVPLDLNFRDEHNNGITLRQLMDGKPVILTLVYYQCPMLCTEVLNGTLNSLKEVPLDMGKDFDVITVSIDPTERSILADAKHTMYAGLYGRSGAVGGWHFLTGDEPQIKQLAASVGFRYAYDPVSKQFAHVSGIVVLTPEGRVSRYLFGIHYAPRDIRLALIEASSEKIGSPVEDAVLLYCYHYDPTTGKYGMVIANILRAGAAITVLVLGLAIFLMFQGEKRRKAAPQGASHRAHGSV
jgi:protein SCO1